MTMKTKAAAAQMRPREWEYLDSTVTVAICPRVRDGIECEACDFSNGEGEALPSENDPPHAAPVTVRDLMRHQQRLTDLIAELARTVETERAAVDGVLIEHLEYWLSHARKTEGVPQPLQALRMVAEAVRLEREGRDEQ